MQQHHEAGDPNAKKMPHDSEGTDAAAESVDGRQLKQGNAKPAPDAVAHAASARTGAVPVTKAAAEASTAGKPAAAAGQSITTDAAGHAAAHKVAAPAKAQPVLSKPAQPKAAAVPAVAATAHAVPPLVHAASGPGSKSTAIRTGSIKRHGSTTSRRLQALLASEELSSLPVLESEGSELPGSRPPAQMHGSLDEGVDEAEQQEIQKIISEIHGDGDSEEDECEEHTPRRLTSKQLARQRLQQAASKAPATSQQQLKPAAVAAGQLPAATAPHDRKAQAGAAVKQANNTASAAMQESIRVVEHQEDESGLQEAESEQDEFEPADDETEDSQQEAIESPAAMRAGQQLLPPANHAPGPESAAEASYQQPPQPFTVAAAKQERHGSNTLGMAAYGAVTNSLQASASAAQFGAGDSNPAEESRSTVIAAQLAQLHEESRRLQLQSQMLQQRAMEMSLRMSSGSGSRPAPGATNSSTGSGNGGTTTDAGGAGVGAVAAVVPLSQVTDLQAAMASGGVSAGANDTSQQQYMTPASQANSVLMSDTMDAYMQLQMGDSLVPPDGVLPRHPPGDVTPSSVTSSRAGLHWNVPSRGSIPSPGKVDSFGTPTSRGDPRAGVSQASHMVSLHTDPSLDYHAYSYNSFTPHKPSASQGPQPQQGAYDLAPAQLYRAQHQQYQQREQADALRAAAAPEYGYHSPRAVAAAAAPVDAAGSGMHAGSSSPDMQELQVQYSQRSLASPGSMAAVARRHPVPHKLGPGASSRVAASGATAGRRVSMDPCDPPPVGVFPAASSAAATAAVVAADGARLGIRRASDSNGNVGSRYASPGRVSPRGAGGGAAAAVPAAESNTRGKARSHAAAGAAAGSPVRAAAAKVGSLVPNTSSSSITAGGGSSSNGASKGSSATALAAAAVAAAADAAGKARRAAAGAAAPWPVLPPGFMPYPGFHPAAAMGFMQPAHGPQQQQQQHKGLAAGPKGRHVQQQQHLQMSPAAMAAAAASMGLPPGAIWGLPGAAVGFGAQPSGMLVPAAGMMSSGHTGHPAGKGHKAQLAVGPTPAQLQAMAAAAVAAAGLGPRGGRRSPGRQQQEAGGFVGGLLPQMPPGMFMMPPGFMNSSSTGVAAAGRGSKGIAMNVRQPAAVGPAAAAGAGRGYKGPIGPAAAGGVPNAAMAAMWGGMLPLFNGMGMPVGLSQQLQQQQLQQSGPGSPGRWR